MYVQLILQSLVEHGATLDATDHHGNTSLHILCSDKANADSAPDCISLLVSQGLIIIRLLVLTQRRLCTIFAGWYFRSRAPYECTHFDGCRCGVTYSNQFKYKSHTTSSGTQLRPMSPHYCSTSFFLHCLQIGNGARLDIQNNQVRKIDVYL